MAAGIEVTIYPWTSRFALDDEPWLGQVSALHTALREEVGPVIRRGAPGPGQKGTLDATMLALGSSGALTAAVACFRAWLARDKTRTLTVTWTDSTGAEKRVQVTGDNIDQASFQALAETLGNRPEER
ncbi:hypothetical protein ACIBK8_34700 [Streptomyces sp. NPDC050161]|uniref:effector-associated constant component EACC1 n=1 Tax=Streptomyces sp. NPDC050161 TaxID=3365604 RepID=UPI00379DFCD8